MNRATEKQYYKDIIKKAIKDEPISMDSITQARVEEVIDALALGCTLQKPRRMGSNYMAAESFRRIAHNIDGTQVAIACNALLRAGDNVKNRCWYILGVLARLSNKK